MIARLVTVGAAYLAAAVGGWLIGVAGRLVDADDMELWRRELDSR